jgi:hypothetical protein
VFGGRVLDRLVARVKFPTTRLDWTRPRDALAGGLGAHASITAWTMILDGFEIEQIGAIDFSSGLTSWGLLD